MMSVFWKHEWLRNQLRVMWAVSFNSGRMPYGNKCMVTIEPTSVCNLSCPLCPTGTGVLERENKYISLDNFSKIVDLTRPVATGYVLNMFGEPTLHPKLHDLLRMTSSLPVWLSTHLNYSHDRAVELAKWEHLHIICSVDTVDPFRYNDYRVGGDWDLMIKNLKLLTAGRCHVFPQFLVEDVHVDQGVFVRFAEELGIPPSNVIIKHKLDDITLDPTDSPSKGCCHSAYGELFFNCDGNLVPCCSNVKADLHMLNIDDIANLDELFCGEKVRRIRKALGRDKNYFASCGRCPGVNYWQKYGLRSLKGVVAKLLNRTKQNKPSLLSFYK